MDSPQVHRNDHCMVDPAWLGSAKVTPDTPVPVGALDSWAVEYTVGRYGMDDGGRLLVCMHTADDSGQPQFDDPAAPGFVTVTTNGDASIRARYQADYWIRPWARAIVISVYDGSLAEGDRITVTLGDTSQGSPGWRMQSFPERCRTIAVLADPFGTKEFYWLPDLPSIDVVPSSAVSVELVLPSRASVGEPIRGHVRLCDRHGNPVRGPQGEATIDCETPTDGLPMTVSLDDGVVAFGPVAFAEPGLFRLAVRAGGLQGESNPIDVHSGDLSERLFWGDMHGQTHETVGTGTVEEYFAFARDKALMDVCAWQGNDFQITDALWRDVQRQTARFHAPGEFVTYLGYEWSGLTPAGGDHNVLYLHDDEPVHRSSHWQIHDGSDTSTDRYPIGELWREFHGRDDVLVIGHVGGRYCNLALANDEFPHLVEVHSHHGTFEWVAEEAMRRGLCVGFCGQSDDHTGRPGLSAPLHPVARGFVTFDTRGGYTGIVASDLTRDALWQALKARHCYATTGHRSLLEFRLGDAMMGDVVRWPAGKPLEFVARFVAQGAPVADLEIRRGTETVYRHAWPEDAESPWIRLEWSGVRVRSRTKNTDWDGRIVATGGTVEDFRPYAFDQPGQGVTRVSDSELAVVSATSGDVDGVLLRVSDPATRITFESMPTTVRFVVSDITPEPRVFPAGGVNQQVRVARFAPEARRHEVRAAWSGAMTGPGREAYWLRVVLADGHMAWSSPIFVDTAG